MIDNTDQKAESLVEREYKSILALLEQEIREKEAFESMFSTSSTTLKRFKRMLEEKRHRKLKF